MKKNQSILLLSIALVCIATSCRKDMNVTDTALNTGAGQQTEDALFKPDVYPFNKNRCLVTYTTDNFAGFVTTVHYNAHNNPDSARVSSDYYGFSTGFYPLYDRFQRLKEIHFD